MLDDLRTGRWATHSSICDEEHEHFRAAVIKKKCSPDCTLILRDQNRMLPIPPIGTSTPSADWQDEEFTDALKRTHLHFAIAHMDIPLIYECIRMGANIDEPDALGWTPLVFAMRQVEAICRADRVLRARNEPFEDNSTKLMIKAATILIEQHAIVNIIIDEQTPLLHACKAKDWSLIKLLLQHGARPPPPDRTGRYPGFDALAESRRFARVIRNLGEHTGRPPRPCPCWSGKLIPECHGAGPQPYPAHFLCACGSDKVYKKCCKRRDFEFLEVWSMQLQQFVQSRRIRHGTDEPDIPYDPEPPLSDPLSEAARHERLATFEAIEAFRMGVETMVEQVGMSDPAFMYAMKKCKWVGVAIPIFWGRKYSKIDNKRRAEEWNAAIDDYIALGTDQRDVRQIERCSKVGIDGGPLYKQCERPGWAVDWFVSLSTCCEVHHLTHLTRLQICYCSATCQRSHWKDHKEACKAKSHKPQLLLSQVVYMRVYDSVVYKLMTTPDEVVETPSGSGVEPVEEPVVSRQLDIA
ncbi:hypothetical protein EVJ58_g5227 [Rhodofomes roseus]|uniref:Uncharacterized protein n=1 Tax=Rhodofomes roseus TaxID=34475 RepID=A0A4Y9YF26_9APHY|nr:hypothetical protein EVJ58_g5227 [Rhodofomes roseus]